MGEQRPPAGPRRSREVTGSVGRHSTLAGRRVGPRKLCPRTVAMLVVALSLPLVGFVSLVQIDYERRHWTNPPLHFVLFLTVGATASLSLITGEAATPG